MSEIQSQKHIYYFGPGKAEGNQKMKELLGGKGANLAEMSGLGIPVPPGFTLTTEACALYSSKGKKMLTEELEASVQYLESVMGTGFGNPSNPCLLSVRSGARVSMPGMMDTVLNLGLNDDSVIGLAKKTGKERFAWDSYRRFVQMYADVVMKVNRNSDNGRDTLEEILEELKIEKCVSTDQELTVDDLKVLVKRYKKTIRKITGKKFPMDPWTQLWNAIMSVFESWNTPRAQFYRKLNDLSDDWGTAVNIQSMVFGNMGENSGSGVAFTRDPATGENYFSGEYLLDAQGEDVVAGIRTPNEITLDGSRRWAKSTGVNDDERLEKNISLEEIMPEVFAELNNYQQLLETHYTEMQDLEFTIQEERLWILQTRTGKRTARSMVRIGMDMLKEQMITEEVLLKRIDVSKLDELLHPIFDETAKQDHKLICQGLPASPGAASGQVVFSSDEALSLSENEIDVILVRIETAADDLKGMNAAKGVLTAKGGMTSHAAVVARGMGKCCVSGASELEIDYESQTMKVNGSILHKGDWLSLNGTTGKVYKGKIETKQPVLDEEFKNLLEIADRYASMRIKTNADTPETARLAHEFGAKGIGLCRTEHMFFEEDRIKVMREMIMAGSTSERKDALTKLLPMQRNDFIEIFKAMEGCPVTIRLMDPPLHEFVPYEPEQQKAMAKELNLSLEVVRSKVDKLSEINPMMGHRGCRLGIIYPEITEMQTRAILEAAISLREEGLAVEPEIMIPLVGTIGEFQSQRKTIKSEALRVFRENGQGIEFKIGTMIEVPRAALVADTIAKQADFFSFGTNDLTQMTFGYSRDDAIKFIPSYIEQGILKKDPFQVIDADGVGRLMAQCVQHWSKNEAFAEYWHMWRTWW